MNQSNYKTLQPCFREFIDVGHAQVPYYRTGSGPDLLFIHGWPVNAETYAEIVGDLSKDYTCHLFDLPGAGKSRWSDDSEINLRGHLATAKKVIEHIGLERYGIVAHDSGAVIARYLAANDPRAAALVFSNSEIPGRHPFALKMLLWMRKLPGHRFFSRLMFKWRLLRRSSLSLGSAYVNKAYIDGRPYQTFAKALAEDPKMLEGALRLLDKFEWSVIDDLAQLHKKIRAKTLMLWGEKDRVYFPVEKAEPMVEQFADARFQRMRGSTFCHEEFPQEFVEHARPFLRDAMATMQVAA